MVNVVRVREMASRGISGRAIAKTVGASEATDGGSSEEGA
jgi:hypothetical protein